MKSSAYSPPPCIDNPLSPLYGLPPTPFLQETLDPPSIIFQKFQLPYKQGGVHTMNVQHFIIRSTVY